MREEVDITHVRYIPFRFGVSRPLLLDAHNRWKHKTLERERKKELYATLGIKKVVRIFGLSIVRWRRFHAANSDFESSTRSAVPFSSGLPAASRQSRVLRRR